MSSKILEAILLTVFFPWTLIFADPWGKDADIATYKEKRVTPCHFFKKTQCGTPLIGPFAELLISFHQKVISPADGPRSHFLPSSSQYTLEAMRKYGFLNGFFLGCDRLMRENNENWVYKKGHNAAGELMKLDPVP